MSIKIAIYTAIFGEKDELKEPLNFKNNENIDYFIISDNRGIKSKCYNLVYKKPIYDDITKNARYYKIIGLEEFKNYDFIIWHDANLQIIQDEILKIITFVDNKEIAFFKHPNRSSVFDEAIKCIQLEKDYPVKILMQVIEYYLKGINCNVELYETSIVLKNNKLISKEFLEFWWFEIKSKSRRDQLSLPYALKKFNIEPGVLDGHREKNDYSNFFRHNHSKYNFVSLVEPKPFNKWYKVIAIRIIMFLK